MKIPAAALLLIALPVGPALAADVVTPFNGLNGSFPASAPNCYKASEVYTGKATCFGATSIGGDANGAGFGTLYQITPKGTKRTTLHSFDVVSGLMPSQSPVLLADKRTLAFTTSQGGAAGSGIVGTYDLQSQEVTVLAAFTGPGGSTAQAPLIRVGNMLYGTAGQGGAHGYGVIWSLPVDGNGGITVIHSFAGGATDTATPFGALTYNPADGLLYGLGFTQAGNGLGGVFSIRTDGSGYALRASFTMSTGGAPQMGALTLSDGMLYGNGWVGGTNSLGTLFRFDPSTNQITAIWNYSKSMGTQPYNGPAVSQSGKWLYVVTWQGGKNGQGSILALAKDGSLYKVLKTLDVQNTGGQSFAGATVSRKGKTLLTATTQGGPSRDGATLAIDIPQAYR